MDLKMKKNLLATTALGMFFAGAAFADSPVITIGGFADFQVGAALQEDEFESINNLVTDANGANVASEHSRDYHTKTDTELHIKIDGSTDNGLKYGALIELEADTNTDANSTRNGNNAERTFVYVETGLGRVEAGANDDAADRLRVDASTFASATGGIAGDYYEYIDLDGSATTASQGGQFYALPGLPTAVMPEEVVNGTHTERATSNKVSYYSPKVAGFKIGASFTPDQGERGTAASFSPDVIDGNGTNANTALFKDVFNAGISFDGEYEGFGVQASLTGETGKAKNVTNGAVATDGLQSYAFGLNLSFAGLTVGGSYAIMDEFGSNRAPGVGDVEAKYWTAGAGYAVGPFSASVTYLDSTITNGAGAGADGELQNLVVGADYQLAPGLVPYVEVSFFETDDGTAGTVDNKGQVFIVGTQVNF